jgi:hypothetical protein
MALLRSLNCFSSATTKMPRPRRCLHFWFFTVEAAALTLRELLVGHCAARWRGAQGIARPTLDGTNPSPWPSPRVAGRGDQQIERLYPIFALDHPVETGCYYDSQFAIALCRPSDFGALEERSTSSKPSSGLRPPSPNLLPEGEGLEFGSD